MAQLNFYIVEFYLLFSQYVRMEPTAITVSTTVVVTVLMILLVTDILGNVMKDVNQDLLTLFALNVSNRSKK